VTPFLRDQWRSDLRIQRVQVPILFIAGEADEQVPPFCASLLYHRATAAPFKSIATIKAGGHHDTLFQPSTVPNALLPFIQSLAFSNPPPPNNPLLGS
jgi:pimeloyl-ACP methyl ester carboxylesterase